MKFSWFITARFLKKKGKFFLSMNAIISFFAVFISTTILVVVISVFNGFQKQMKKSIFDHDPHLTIEKTFGTAKISDYKYWVKKAKNALKGHYTIIEGMIQSPAIVKKGRMIETVLIRGQRFKTIKVNNQIEYQIPDFFPKLLSKRQESYKGQICFIGTEMASYMGLKEGSYIELVVPRGQFSLKVGMTPSMRRFKIVGVFKTGHYDYDSKGIIIPLRITQKLFKIGDSVQQIIVRIKDTDKLNWAKYRLYQSYFNIFSVQTLADKQKNLFSALRLEKTVMTIIVFLLIISAMSFIVVATFSVVRAKRKEIGILKAIGVSNSSILTIFTLNGFLMGAMGTILGILFGIFLTTQLENIIYLIEDLINFWRSLWVADTVYFEKANLIPRDVYYFDKLPVYFDIPFLMWTAGVSIFISALSGFIPALSAAKLQAIDIIRRAEK